MAGAGVTVTVTVLVVVPAPFVTERMYVVVLAGFTISVPPFGLTETGLPGSPGAEIVADVPPDAAQESVDAPPEHTGEAEAAKLLIAGGCMTVIVMS